MQELRTPKVAELTTPDEVNPEHQETVRRCSGVGWKASIGG
jgi:hypothetical protein